MVPQPGPLQPWHARYKLSRRKQVVKEYFDCGSEEPDWTPRYNIAPTQPVPVVRQNPKEPVRQLSLNDSSLACRGVRFSRVSLRYSSLLRLLQADSN
jgi:hypothetical protein